MREICIKNHKGELMEAHDLKFVPFNCQLVFTDSLCQVFPMKSNNFIHNTEFGWIYDPDELFLGENR